MPLKLTLDEKLSFLVAGALMGKDQVILTTTMTIARDVRRRLKRLKMPPEARKRIKVKVASSGSEIYEMGVCVK